MENFYILSYKINGKTTKEIKLLKQAMKKDCPDKKPAAAEELEGMLEEHHQESFGWALACCRYNRFSAEDVLQTVYLKILEGKARFNGHSSFKTWLYSVIRITASDLRRRRRLKEFLPAALGIFAEQNQCGSVPEQVRLTELQHEKTRLENALLQLPVRQQEVLHLVFYQDLTIEQAGEVLKISPGSARTHYERGKARLRRLLGQ